MAAIARRWKTSPATVRLWSRRYHDLGLDSLLRDRPGRGRKAIVDRRRGAAWPARMGSRHRILDRAGNGREPVDDWPPAETSDR